MEFVHPPQKSVKVRNALCPLELKGKTAGTSVLHMAVTFTHEAPFGEWKGTVFSLQVLFLSL